MKQSTAPIYLLEQILTDNSKEEYLVYARNGVPVPIGIDSIVGLKDALAKAGLTEEVKQEIVNDVIDALPTYKGEAM
jgi:hypothetical protein